MSSIRRLIPILRSSLLFGLVGMPLGAVVFLTGIGLVEGKPLAAFRILGYPDVAAALTAFFGGIPAIATGAVAVFLRRKARSLLRFAYVMTPTGAAITAIYLLIVLGVLGGLRWRPEIFVLAGGITATGGVTALCCALLLCRRRSQSGR